MAYVPVSIAPGSPAKISDINNLNGNLEALAAGDAGAPKIQQAAMDIDSVSLAQLKTSEAVLNTNLTGSDNQRLAMPGGSYSFFPVIAITQAGTPASQNGWVCSIDLAGYADEPSDISNNMPMLRLSCNLSSGTTIVVTTQKYIDASPPYNLGHGDIQEFIFLQCDQDNNIKCSYIATSPPWAYNGKTNIIPDQVESDGFGGLIKKKRIVCKESCPTHPKDGGDAEEYANYLANPKTELVEICHGMKNADMVDIPHPFLNSDQDRVILLDPTSKVVDQLALMRKNGEDIYQLIEDGYLLIGDEIMDCNKPNGVHVHSVMWRK